MLGQSFALFRTEEGAPAVLLERCPHRGSPLWLGFVEGDQLRCMHHGWCFDPSGHCAEIPGGGPSLRARATARAFPAVDHLGLILAYFGEGEPPPLPRLSYHERAAALCVLPPDVWPCSFFERLANTCDMMHVPYAHRRSGVGALLSGELAIECEETDYGLRVHAQHEYSEVKLIMPNALLFRAPLDERVGWTHHLVWRVPIDDERCVSFSVAAIPSDIPHAEEYARAQPLRSPLAPGSVAERGQRVLAGEVRLDDISPDQNLTEIEDYVALVGMRGFAERELSSPADEALLLLRKLWRRDVAAAEAGTPRAWSLAGV